MWLTGRKTYWMRSHIRIYNNKWKHRTVLRIRCVGWYIECFDLRVKASVGRINVVTPGAFELSSYL
ncbi:hypothetical protein Sjap_002434 [Stephania japonica]|uniref:Uncharacterized protein n=1 Tax=Stephania japonica TaxID=461633 RepID=A0AAP0KNN0_9MAGN